MLFVDLQIRIKDLKPVYLNLELNDVIFNALFLALLEVTIYDVYNLYLFIYIATWTESQQNITFLSTRHT